MGKESNSKLVHKCSLLRAAIYEILRISSGSPSGLPYSSDKEYWMTMDDGTRYKILKNCGVFANLDYIHIYGGNNEHWKRTNGDKIFLENFSTKDDVGGIRFVMNESIIVFWSW